MQGLVVTIDVEQTKLTLPTRMEEVGQRGKYVWLSNATERSVGDCSRGAEMYALEAWLILSMHMLWGILVLIILMEERGVVAIFIQMVFRDPFLKSTAIQLAT